ncbi:hypothetical protein HDV00_002121 [Rhizophlyctis rosea]|nr:hypothetical protein HDV00_002121 [Rhizophlyctis rosea]
MRHPNERREEIEVAFQDVRPGRLSRMGTVAKVAGGGGDVFRVRKVRRVTGEGKSGVGDGGDVDAMERGEGRMSSETGFRSESSLHPLVQFVNALSVVDTTLPRPAPALTPPESPVSKRATTPTTPLAVLSTPTWFVTPTPSTRPQHEKMFVGSPQDLPLLPISPHPFETSPRSSSLFNNDTLKRLMSRSGQQAVEVVRRKEEEDGVAPVGSGQDVIGSARMSVVEGEKTLRFMKCLEEYQACMDDEMTIRVGDEVLVEIEYADGWAFAYNVITEKCGIVPLVCLGPVPALRAM